MKTTDPKFATLPEEVQLFVTALHENAKLAFGDKSFAESIAGVEMQDDGSIVVCDNYERFFSTMYTYYPDGRWTVRTMYSEQPEREYDFQRVMCDARIMHTG